LKPLESASPVRYWNGAVVLNEIDLTVPGGAFFEGQKTGRSRLQIFGWDDRLR
jgi:hypothetical protein